MRSQSVLEWTFEDGEERWPAPEKPGPRSKVRWRRRVLYVALALTGISISLAVILHLRVSRNQRVLKADFQALVDLESRAIANGDRELFLSLKSRGDASWFEWQSSSFEGYVANPRQWPRLIVTGVELMDDYAWVHTVGKSAASAAPVEWVRFYRHQNDRWTQVAPDLRYWGAERERDVGQFHFIYHERDDRHIKPIAEFLARLLRPLCSDLGCEPDMSLTVRLTLPYPYTTSETQVRVALELPSPSEGQEPLALPYPVNKRTISDQTRIKLAGMSAKSRPTLHPQSALVSRASYALVPFLAFETAGGDGRWSGTVDGVRLVSSVIQWAQEQQWERIFGAEATSPFEANRELQRLIVRNGQVPSLDQIWRNKRDRRVPYPALIRVYAWPTAVPGAHAQSVIDYIIEVYGRQAVPALLAAIAQNDTFDGALRDALDLDQEAFETQWLAWLQAKKHGLTGNGPRLQ